MRSASTETMLTWNKTSTGYDLSNGKAKLVQSSKTWTLVLVDGRTFPMPKKPTFDHAEAILSRNP